MNESLLINGIHLCIKKAGNQRRLSELLGVAPSTISAWLYRDKKIPPLMAIKAEKLLSIPRDVLRPDIEW